MSTKDWPNARAAAAADEIERLRVLNAELLAALESAPEPTSAHAWLFRYVEWHRKSRATIAKAKEQA
jgi:hypothetical protein